MNRSGHSLHRILGATGGVYELPPLGASVASGDARVGSYPSTVSPPTAYPSSAYPFSASPPGGYNAADCPRDQWTNGYFRSDGTYVQGYWHNSPTDGCGGG